VLSSGTEQGGYAYRRIRKRVESDPAAASYRDEALAPVTDNETGVLEIFRAKESAKQAVEKSRRRKTLGFFAPAAAATLSSTVDAIRAKESAFGRHSW
jgi:hypothetical protein